MSKMHYFSNKFSKIAKRWETEKRWGLFPQRPLTFNIGDDLAKLEVFKLIMTK